jgi:hypothetical protein
MPFKENHNIIYILFESGLTVSLRLKIMFFNDEKLKIMIIYQKKKNQFILTAHVPSFYNEILV